MRVKCINRSEEAFTRERAQDLQKVCFLCRWGGRQSCLCGMPVYLPFSHPCLRGFMAIHAQVPGLKQPPWK